MHAQRKLVSFIGLGSLSSAPLLYSYIKMHPKVCALAEDTEFFSNTKVYSQGIIWYESQFAKCALGTVCGELSYNYLKSAPSVALITGTYPGAKLLAVVENPLLSVRIAYVEARYNRTIGADVSLAMFLKQNPEVLSGVKYGRQLAEYFSYYSPNDLLVVVASDVKDETLKTLAQVYDHLGVDKNFIPLVLQHLIPIDEDEIKHRPGIIKRSYRFIKKTIKNSYRHLVKIIHPPKLPVETASVVAEKLSLSPELKAYLHNYYQKDVAMLSHLLHRDLLVEWGFSEN